jgi:4-hydroxybenzoate polyprenyltransferase
MVGQYYHMCKNILTNLAHMNIIISLGPLSFAIMTIMLFSLEFDYIAVLIPFFITFFIYSINRFTDLNEDKVNNPERTEFVKKQINFFLFGSLLSFAMALILSFIHSFFTLIIILAPTLLVLAYSMKWIPEKLSNEKRLKEIFLVKNMIVSLGWSIIPLYISVYFGVFPAGIFFVSIFIFLRIFMGVMIFDMRDTTGDKFHKINTLAIVYGEKVNKKILQIINIISFLVILSAIILKLLPFNAIFVGIFAMLMGFLYIHLLNRKYNLNFMCDIVVDGEYALIGLVYFIVTILPVIIAW